MKYRSHAKWPKGTCDSSNNVSTDDHDTREQAEAVCTMLTQKGFGGDGKVFPVHTWVGLADAPTPPKPDAGATPRTDAERMASHLLLRIQHASCGCEICETYAQRETPRMDAAEHGRELGTGLPTNGGYEARKIERELRATKADLHAAQTELAEARERRKLLETQIAGDLTALSELRRELSALRNELAEVEKERDAARGVVEELELQIQRRDNAEEEQAISGDHNLIPSLTASRDEAQKQLTAKDSAMTAAFNQHRDMEAELSKVIKERDALRVERDEARRVIEYSQKAAERDLESSSIVASCDCHVKTPEIQYHKPGCKYRLISERGQLAAEVTRLREALQKIAAMRSTWSEDTIESYRDSGNSGDIAEAADQSTANFYADIADKALAISATTEGGKQ